MPRDFLGLAFNQTPGPFTPGVVLLDDMEGTQQWSGAGTGGDDTFEYSSDRAFTQTQSLKMQTRLTSTAEDDIVNGTKVVAVGRTQLLKTKLRYYVVGDDGMKEWIVSYTINVNGRALVAKIRVATEDEKLYFWNFAGAWIEVTDADLGVGQDGWGSFELELNLDSESYGEFLLDGGIVAVNGLSFQDIGTSTARRTQIVLSATASAAGAALIYFDNFIVYDQLAL